MSLLRRIVLFPITLILLWAVFAFLGTFLLGLVPFPAERSKTAMALASLLALVLLARLVERRPLREAGLGLKGALRDLAGGFGVASAIMTAVIGVLALAGWYRIGTFTWDAGLFAFGLYTCLLTAVMEEVALRGVFFRVIEARWGSWIGLAASALLFGLLHLGNPNASLLATLAIAVEAGLWLGAAYMLTRSLWLAVGIHWGWNFMEGYVFGTPLSGFPSRGLVDPVITGPEWATGGMFGPEAGVVALLLCTGAGLGYLWLAHRRGRIIPA